MLGRLHLPPLAAEDPAQLAALSLFGGRYRITGLLSRRGGLATACAMEAAAENEEGSRLLIRIASLDRFSPAALARRRRDAQLLAAVESPAIAPWRQVASDERHVGLVRDFLPGVSLEDRLAAGPLELAEALQVGERLLEALRVAHAAGVLHQGVRPANIILREEAAAGAALVDFGPAVLAADSRSLAEEREAAWYLSPEQAGAIDCEVGPAADIYSAGAVLFHCFSGRPPFDADTVGGVLHLHVTARVAELRSLGLKAPRALDEVLQRMLRKDPRDRYQAAEAVLADWRAIVAALAAGDDEPALVIGARDRRRTLTEPAFVGRADEIARFDDQWRLAAAGEKRLLLLESESGGGKSRLLAEASRRAAHEGAWVLRGQGSHQVGQRPCQVLEGVASEFATAAKLDPSLAARVRAYLDDQAAAVCSALPKLAGILGSQAAEVLGPESFGENRTVSALAAFLDALGAAGRPTLVILDDCQWADDLSLKLLAHWARRRDDEAGVKRMLLVVAFREEEAPADHPLRALPAHAAIRLTPFSPGDVRQLVESMAGPLPEEAVEAVIRLSEGSPFMASAVLRGLVESGALAPLDDASAGEPQGNLAKIGWRVEPLAIADLQSSRHAAAFLSRRIDLLPLETARLLTVGAVLGKEFDLEAAAALAGQVDGDALASLEEARRRQLVWAKQEATRFLFVHDRLRAAFLDRLSSDERRELHRRAAHRLRELSPGKVFDLAYHFDAAGDSAAALGPALVAAEQARAQHALEIAEQQYRIAERGAEFADAASGYRIAQGLGDVLMLRGRYDEAAGWFARAAGLAEARYDRAQIRCKLGELAFKRGDMEAATAAFEESLRMLGAMVPRRLPGFVIMLAFEAFVQIWHTLLPGIFVARRRKAPSPAEVLSWRVFSRLAHGYWFTRGKVHVLWTHIRGMNLAERYEPTLELAQAYSEHAPAMSLIPLYNRGIHYARKSLEIRRSFADLWGQGQSLHYYGVVLYTASRFAGCIEKCREAVRLLERTGDYWEVHTARYQIAAALYRLGDLPAAKEESQTIYRSGIDLGDEQASGICLDVWSRATGGATPAEVIEPELKRTRHDAQGFAQVMLAEGVRLIGAERPADAQRVFEQALAEARKAGVMNSYVSPNLAWLATAMRIQAERYDGYVPAARSGLLRKASRACWRALSVAIRFRNDLPHVLRELALVYCLLGRAGLARRLLNASRRVAQRQNARYEEALTLAAYGRVGRELGWPEADATFEQGETLLRTLRGDADHAAGQAPATLSLVDRFDVVLHAGRNIALALSQAAIFRELRAAAARLLRAEECLLLDVAASGEVALRADDEYETDEAETPFALQAAARCLADRRAAAVDEEAVAALANADQSPERSALAAPIYVRGRAVACFYVVHHGVRGLFGPDEERVADFLATIAGAALENAEGFEQLQELNVTLEQRVADRTAAAESRAQELAISNDQLARIAAELRETEEQLRVAMAAADSANQAKSRFLAAMSHEIRTPLNGITGMTELALCTPLTPQQQTYLNIVKQSADALLRLLNDILDLSKIEAGKLELEEIPFDLGEIVGDAAQVMAARACEKKLDLAFRVAPNAPRKLLGDPGRLRQILVNLLGNAIKFTERGEVIVEASLAAESEANEQGVAIHFSVRDTGIGIPADKQSRLFAAFCQADSSTTRKFGGTGLGLAISRQLVELMQGRIWLESEPGVGSTFAFVAHFRAAAVDDAAAEQTPFEGAADGLAEGAADGAKAIRALVVDDHEPTRRFSSELLSAAGIEAHDCDPRRAVEQLLAAARGDAAFDVLLCDAELGDVDGAELIAELRRQRELADCAIVVALPAGHPEIGARCREQGLTQFVTKPAKPAELLAAVRAALPRFEGNAPRQANNILAAKPTRSLSILLAEDGPINQEVAVGLLEMRGHQVTVADNGRLAVEAMARQAFDVVLMDLEMPEMDGMAATAAIRLAEQDSHRQTPIIAMTAHAIKGFREQCLAAGMNGYVSKPIQPAELFAAVEQASTNEVHECILQAN